VANASERKRQFAIVALLVVLQATAALVYLWVEHDRETDVDASFRYERVDAGLRIPDALLVRADGSSVASDSFRGRPTLLHIWATSCPPCRDELPSLLRYAAEHPSVRVVALSTDAEWSPVDRFFAGSIPREVMRDPGGDVVRALRVQTLPDTYLLDSGGAARLRFVGTREWSSDHARAVLDRFLLQLGGPR